MHIVHLFATNTNINDYYLNPLSSTYIETIYEENFIKDIPAGSMVAHLLTRAYITSKFTKNNCTQICTTDTTIQNSIIILHKHFFHQRELLYKIKQNNNILVFDILDGVGENIDLADAILCSSHGAYQYYSTIQNKCPVFFVEHCLDLRMKPIMPFTDHFSAYYFGGEENLFFYNSIFKYIRPCFASYKGRIYTDFIKYLPLANFHYAIRSKMSKFIFKPFTKGFVASYNFSNILIHKDDGDADIYLGSEYPYLIQEDLTENIILDYIQKAQDDFGGKDWHTGLEIMQSLRKYFDPAYISAQYWAALEQVRDSCTIMPACPSACCQPRQDNVLVEKASALDGVTKHTPPLCIEQRKVNVLKDFLKKIVRRGEDTRLAGRPLLRKRTCADSHVHTVLYLFDVLPLASKCITSSTICWKLFDLIPIRRAGCSMPYDEQA